MTMKHYPVIAELVDEASGKRFLPGETFMPANEKQRKRLVKAGCLGEDEVDPLGDIGDLPLGELSREHLENIAFAIARQQIANVSDDELRSGIASHRERQAADHDSGNEGKGGDDADGLDDNTVEQLKKLAEDEQVDLSGKTLKADIVAAIRSKRGAA